MDSGWRPEDADSLVIGYTEAAGAGVRGAYLLRGGIRRRPIYAAAACGRGRRGPPKNVYFSNSPFHNTLPRYREISLKKVAEKFGGFVGKLYLCTRFREASPQRSLNR